MNTYELLNALAESFKQAAQVLRKAGPEEAEKLLSIILRLWLYERPLQLHTLN